MRNDLSVQSIDRGAVGGIEHHADQRRLRHAADRQDVVEGAGRAQIMHAGDFPHMVKFHTSVKKRSELPTLENPSSTLRNARTLALLMRSALPESARRCHDAAASHRRRIA